MSNGISGEQEIKLGGKTYTIKASTLAIAEIRDRTGVPLGKLVRDLGEGNYGPDDVAKVIYSLLLGGGNKSLSFDQVYELIMKEGFTKFLPNILHFVKITYNPSGEEATKGNEPEPQVMDSQ